MKNKHYSSRKAAKLALLLALLTAVVPTVQAQEYIKEILDLTRKYSLIREYKEDKRVLCTFDDDSVIFAMVTDGGTMSQYLSLKGKFSVNDMEVYGDTLYFCGEHYGDTQIGYFGYMDLMAFPSATVNINLLPSLLTCKKMEVMRSCFDNGLHIYITSDVSDTGDCLVDIRENGYSSWDCNRSTGDVRERIYDDVAVTDNYVIVTVRNPTDSSAYLYGYAHPAPGNHIFYQVAAVLNMNLANVVSCILVESCEQDYYVLTFKSEVVGQNPLPLYMPLINVFSFNGIFSIYLPKSYYVWSAGSRYPIDLKYNPVSRETDVLVRNYQSSVSVIGEIFHIDASGNAVGRHYDDVDFHENLHSLDFLHYDPVHFIASGVSIDNALRIYKYDPQEFKRCSNEFPITNSGYKDLKLERDNLFLEYIQIEPVPIQMEQATGDKKIELRCYVNSKDDE